MLKSARLFARVSKHGQQAIHRASLHAIHVHLTPAACLRGPPRLSYKRPMAQTTYFPRRLILAGAMISGVLLALAVHMLGARYGLDLGGLWQSDTHDFMPAGAAIAWWLIATMGFSG